MSVVGGTVLFVSRPLRRIAAPVVAAGPSGKRFRTRLHLSPTEAAALAEIGELLGSLYRRELAGRIRLGRVDRKAQSVWRAERKRALTAVSSSRWAGALTRAVEDQYQLGMRALGAHVGDLQSAIEVLEQRCALRPGETAAEDTADGGRRRRPKRGYATAGERFSKTRRLACLRHRLVAAQEDLGAGHPAVTVGGKRLWRNRLNLAAAGIDESQWRQRWDAARLFVTADGETGKNGGNETIRVDDQGRLRLKVPAALAAKYGTHLQVAAPVRFSHGGCDLAARIAANQAVRYDISFDAARAAGIWMRPGRSPPIRPPSSTSCGRAGCSGWISTPITSPRVSWTPPVTLSPNRSPSVSRCTGCGPPAATAASERRLPRCWTPHSSTGVRRLRWRTSTSPRPASPAGKPWAAASAGRPSGAPSPPSRLRGSGTG